MVLALKFLLQAAYGFHEGFFQYLRFLLQAHPMNAATALKQRAVLMDDIWHAAGDRSTDMDWYTKRALLGGVYTATELYMLTDYSPGNYGLDLKTLFLL